MPYTALPDRRMPYDNDGSQVGRYTSVNGILSWLSSGERIELNDHDYANVTWSLMYSARDIGAIVFFPETREVTGIYAWVQDDGGAGSNQPITGVQGSTDSVNGLDGSWEAASMPSGYPGYANDYYWRSDIKPVSFTGPKRTVKAFRYIVNDGMVYFYILHLYGEKAAGQTPDDVIFINHDDTPGVEFTAPEDFGDQPLGTTVVRQWRLKNTSATKTANTINIQCNDSDFSISEDGVNWVVTINLASLAAGAESATYYVRCVTPAVGALLGPRHSRIVVTVASYT
jgi:hypothetical protein